MSSAASNELVSQLHTETTPQEIIDAAVKELESTPEGLAWLEATAALKKQYKYEAVVVRSTTASAPEIGDKEANGSASMEVHTMNAGAYKDAATASGNFWSRPIPFWPKVGLQVKSDNLRRIYKVEDEVFWLAAPGFQAGTLYYDDINDLSGNASCLVGPASAYFSVTFSNSSKDNYATFQAANVGLPNLPIPLTLNGGKWESY